MNTPICPNCQSPIPADAPGGICPACALLGASGPTAAPDFPGGEPTIEEVAAAFPELEVVDVLGQGGMGIVFKARQPKLDRFIALKILPPALAAQAGFVERFNREARALAKLSHPNIVGVFDFGERAGFCYLAMEHVDGVNLRAAMRAGVTPEIALALVPAVCEALQFAHDHGVLHRDIKPENILLDTRGVPKLADFGIAKLADDQTGSGLTMSGAQLGTAAYMAPEQVEKPATVDHRADIYSLGVVLYEMLTGELPLGRFAAPSEKSHVTRGVDEVVLRALEKERERRQQSATEMKSQVETATAAGQRPAAAGSGPARPGDAVWSTVFRIYTWIGAIGVPIAALGKWELPSALHMVIATVSAAALGQMAQAMERKRAAAADRGAGFRMAVQFAVVFALLALAVPGFVVKRMDATAVEQRAVADERQKQAEMDYERAERDLRDLTFEEAADDAAKVSKEARMDGAKKRLSVADDALHAAQKEKAQVFEHYAQRDRLGVGAMLGGGLGLLALSFAMVAWMRRPRSDAGPSLENPWPKRVFWLIIGIVVVPAVMLIVATNLLYFGPEKHPRDPRPSVSQDGKNAALEDEAIKLARQIVEDTRKRAAAGVATPMDAANALLKLATAEARGDAVKIAEARIAFFEEHLKIVQQQVSSGAAPVESARQVELQLNEARQELEKARKAVRLEQ